MSAVGDAGYPAGHAAGRLLGSFWSALRLFVGWFSIAIGILNLLVELDRGGSGDGAYLAFHIMLVIGGVLLVSFTTVGAGAGVAGYCAGGAVLAGGMILSGVRAFDAACCMTAYAARHGYPFTFAARDAGRWHLDGPHLLADLLFWGYAGLIVLVAVASVRRAVRRTAPRDDGPGSDRA
ncbi:hypothetical protein ACFQFC_27475 [Amorphoplanes digitatis]|uniref:Uncharacterized protein n=1 Tax=Actinoplanes digitatis TaxID=1868 RepID=A0A7W7HS98_9ACTN|nr:hypothetical protein [Actinoplanes digitatis]MBB4759885.1 hypothetical protein [Actinoplanes digitatis]GID94490.1 hypothetical protein Adi01nite_39020 [Actinoplanes digitatis]